MTMQMHMLGAMFAPSDKLTLMVMGKYVDNTMALSTKMNMDFETQSDGFGDISITGLLHVLRHKRQLIHTHIGISIPVGNLNQLGDTPMMNRIRLAYPMQLGSGTWDPFFGATYLGQSETTSWGIQSIFKVRLGQNAKGYSLGNQWNVVGWYAFRLSNTLSLSGSLQYLSLGRIDGFDQDMNPMMMPLFDAKNSGKNLLNGSLGVNVLISKGVFKNLRIALEGNIPVAQSVNGIQMKHSWTSVFGLQYALHSH
jgi:hypothetical protein